MLKSISDFYIEFLLIMQTKIKKLYLPWPLWAFSVVSPCWLWLKKIIYYYLSTNLERLHLSAKNQPTDEHNPNFPLFRSGVPSFKARLHKLNIVDIVS